MAKRHSLRPVCAQPGRHSLKPTLKGYFYTNLVGTLLCWNLTKKESYQQEPKANARPPGQAFAQGVIAGRRNGQRAKAVEDVALYAVQFSRYLRISGTWLALSASDFFRSARCVVSL